MDNQYTQEYTVLPSVCDSAALLSVPDTFALFMDLAAIHAELLRFDTPTLMKQGLFWLTVRTRIRFRRRPKMAERVTLVTWPEQPGKLRTDRDYVVEQNGERLIEGKTEWTIWEMETGKMHPMAGIFPPDFVFYPDAVWTEPFTRAKDEPLDEFARYTVRSTDIDLGGHMNNAAYVRAIAGAFSREAWQGMDIREMEIAFRAPCYEGDTLVLQKRDEGDALSLRAALPDGKTIVLAKIIKNPKP